MSEWSRQEQPEVLRARAQWYREFAAICGGDPAWALNLAKYFERLANEREQVLRREGTSV